MRYEHILRVYIKTGGLETVLSIVLEPEQYQPFTAVTAKYANLKMPLSVPPMESWIRAAGGRLDVEFKGILPLRLLAKFHLALCRWSFKRLPLDKYMELSDGI